MENRILSRLYHTSIANISDLVTFLYDDPDHDTLVFFYSSERHSHAYKKSEKLASFFDTVAMRFEQHQIFSVDFVAYDVYHWGLPETLFHI